MLLEEMQVLAVMALMLIQHGLLQLILVFLVITQVEAAVLAMWDKLLLAAQAAEAQEVMLSPTQQMELPTRAEEAAELGEILVQLVQVAQAS
jgi:hypothetical protein